VNPLTESLLLFATGLVAGTLNVVAGGGSLLTLPVLIFAGLPPTVANGTNRIGILVQNVGASWAFHRRGLLERKPLIRAVGPVVVGAAVGTWVATGIGDLAFKRVLAGVLVVAALWMLRRAPEAPPDDGGDRQSGLGRLGFALGWLAVGFYGGFIQAGVGFVILALAGAAGLDLVRGNALKVTLVLAFTPISLLIFAHEGMVEWRPWLALAAGTLLGGQLGVHLTAVRGHAWIKRVVTVVVVLFAIRLWWP